MILKFIWKGKRPRIANSVLKNKVGGLTVPDFKTYYKAIVTRQHGIGERINKQISGTEESPEIDTHNYNQLIFKKGAKIVFSTNGAGTTRYAHAKKVNLSKDFTKN